MGIKSKQRCLCLASNSILLGAWIPQAWVSRTLQDASGYESHEQWMARCGCVYNDNIEKEKRSNIFKQNVARIEAFNNKANNEKPYKLAVNVFADITNEEFKVSRETDSGATCVPNKRVHSSMKMSLLCLPIGTEERKVPSHPSMINNNAVINLLFLCCFYFLK